MNIRGQITIYKKAFTLVEIAISIAIISLIAAGIFMILTSGSTSWNQETVLLELQQQARSVVEGMIKEIRQTDPSQSISITDSDQKIVFYIVDITNPVSYYLSNGEIIREHPAGNTRIIANNINSLSFSYAGNTIGISLVAEKTDRQGRSLSYPLKAKVRFRNE